MGQIKGRPHNLSITLRAKRHKWKDRSATRGGLIMQPKKLMPSVAIVTLAFVSSGGATDPSGVVSNVLLAQGRTISSLKERIKVGAEWVVALEDNGESE